MRVMRVAGLYQLGSVALFSLVSLLWTPEMAVGVLSGGLLMTANFWFLKTMVVRLMRDPNPKAKILYAFLLASKFAAVLAAMTLLSVILELNPLAMAIGMMSLFTGLGAGLFHSWWLGPPQTT